MRGYSRSHNIPLVFLWKLYFFFSSRESDPQGSLDLAIRMNGICTTRNRSLKMRRTKSPCGFEAQTGRLISARRPDLGIVDSNKKKKEEEKKTFDVPTDHRVKLVWFLCLMAYQPSWVI